jgi:predicted porin
MHISTLAAAALMALATAVPAAAQNAITFYGGWRGGGSFEQDTSP